MVWTKQRNESWLECYASWNEWLTYTHVAADAKRASTHEPYELLLLST